MIVVIIEMKARFDQLGDTDMVQNSMEFCFQQSAGDAGSIVCDFVVYRFRILFKKQEQDSAA